jgi:hypothetical protein
MQGKYRGSVRPMRPKAVQEYFEKIARKGGRARAAKLTKEQRKEIARNAVQARWAKQRALAKEITEGTKELLRVAKKRQRALKKKRHV